ncbi:hypothetical protein CRG98_032320 [Punica granatum]|uniref:Uncharacterized protein n=1 Tax=Punica granatum TaxID=22663 RepID=A0A2I0ITF3_PUNGR|nr:hypothetical protein CRG98_032320 [Punica granatum]
MARGSQEGLSATSLGVRLLEPIRSPQLQFKYFPDMLAFYTMETYLVGVKQTRLAPDEKTDLRDAPGGLLMQGRKETALSEASYGISLQGWRRWTPN